MAEQSLSFDDSAAYERAMGRWSRAVAPAFLDWVAPPSGARWLEVGCGTGVFTELVVDTVCARHGVRRRPVKRANRPRAPPAGGTASRFPGGRCTGAALRRRRLRRRRRRARHQLHPRSAPGAGRNAPRRPCGRHRRRLRVGLRGGTFSQWAVARRDAAVRCRCSGTAGHEGFEPGRARLAVSGRGFRERRHPVHRGDATVFQLRRVLAGADAQL